MLAAVRRSDTIAADLGRVLACWLVVVLLAQAQAALQALVHGPSHRHAAVAAGFMTTTATARADAEHDLAHARGEAHHHAVGEALLPADGEAALDTAACVLMAALVPLAAQHAWPACAGRTALVAAPAWALREAGRAPPRRPPRG